MCCELKWAYKYNCEETKKSKALYFRKEKEKEFLTVFLLCQSEKNNMFSVFVIKITWLFLFKKKKKLYKVVPLLNVKYFPNTSLKFNKEERRVVVYS